ncbi:hypothetical protein CTA2_12356 [Colletotrichum tanaceti]|uniref:Uncharacterized protein n=1 Tax=Colletotrichum tanaceti TaxID=1306861 RepID=A0A4U6XIF5_9PEZI|nr:hypothetical protein CTA2_12356 [Colletotrichum tanaceti]TKW55748.1 hypothetical protein CTA1_10657 [Colletotrichum tanaceti]
MWRFFRPRGGAASATTLAARMIAPRVSNQQTIIVQRVKISKPIFRARNFLLGAGISLACWQIYWSFVLNPLFQHVDREYENLSEAEKKALDDEIEEEVAAPWFIPFPFTTKAVFQPPYKPTDPEWARFVQLSKDKEGQKQIRTHLSELVRAVVERDPGIAARFGNSVKLRRYWLDIDFPSRPPPVFISSGLLLQNDQLYWTTQEVDSYAVWRLNKFLWPEAAALSTWTFFSTLVKKQVTSFSQALGFASSTPAHSFPPVQGGNMQQKAEGPLPSANRQTPDGTPAENASHSVSKTADSRQEDGLPSGGSTNFVRETAMAQVESMKHITQGPVRAFWRKLQQSWRQPRQYPPRGCVVVSGFVECDLPKAMVLIDVWGFWDPKTKSFHPGSTVLNLRRIQLKRQSAARK